MEPQGHSLNPQGRWFLHLQLDLQIRLQKILSKGHGLIFWSFILVNFFLPVNPPTISFCTCADIFILTLNLKQKKIYTYILWKKCKNSSTWWNIDIDRSNMFYSVSLPFVDWRFLCKHQTPTLPNCYVIWMAEQIGRSLVLFVQEEPLYKAPL